MVSGGERKQEVAMALVLSVSGLLTINYTRAFFIPTHSLTQRS